VLIEKKEGTQAIGDYRPISVMHIIAKILQKNMANRLAPHLNSIVSHSQSAFIKGRSIHDNLQYVHGDVKHFHQAKTHMLLFKLDIAKAFDSICWEYLLDLLEQLGFVQR
jgi:retron-type reverse transcriptase